MVRFLYTLCMVALISGTAWAAAELQQERPKGPPGRVGFIILTALQR